MSVDDPTLPGRSSRHSYAVDGSRARKLAVAAHTDAAEFAPVEQALKLAVHTDAEVSATAEVGQRCSRSKCAEVALVQPMEQAVPLDTSAESTAAQAAALAAAAYTAAENTAVLAMVRMEMNARSLFEVYAAQCRARSGCDSLASRGVTCGGIQWAEGWSGGSHCSLTLAVRSGRRSHAPSTGRLRSLGSQTTLHEPPPSLLHTLPNPSLPWCRDGACGHRV